MTSKEDLNPWGVEEHLSLCDICRQARYCCIDVSLDGGDIHACPQCLASFYVDETVERTHIQ